MIGDVKINSSLRAMKFDQQGKLVRDTDKQVAAIAARCQVGHELVNAVFRLRPLGSRHDEASLLRLADYLLAGARKPRTPPEHTRMLEAWAAHVLQHVEATRAGRGKVESAPPKVSGTAAPAVGAVPAARGSQQTAALEKPLTPAQLRVVLTTARAWSHDAATKRKDGQPLNPDSRRTGAEHLAALTQARDAEVRAKRTTILATIDLIGAAVREQLGS